MEPEWIGDELCVLSVFEGTGSEMKGWQERKGEYSVFRNIQGKFYKQSSKFSYDSKFFFE